jgi:hypothetical protein
LRLNGNIHHLKKATAIPDQPTHSDCRAIVQNKHRIDRAFEPFGSGGFREGTKASHRTKMQIFLHRWAAGYSDIG